MLIVKLQGGLGNQLFQYAIGLHLSKCKNVQLKFDLNAYQNLNNTRIYKLHEFNSNVVIASDSEINRLMELNTKVKEKFFIRLLKNYIPYYKYPIVTERFFHYDRNIYKIGEDAYLDGYWQSEKYFLPASSEIIKSFEFVSQVSGENKTVLDDITEKQSVSLHIRRGDYVSVPKFNKKFGVCSLEYYQKAINCIKEQVKSPHFYIFSDDIPWVKNNIDSFGARNELTIVEHNNAEMDHEDLRLISHCKHNIIANSSFSWWGAWLNNNPNKIVIAPKIWFSGVNFNTNDLIPTGWARV